nr:hypothetical protein [Lachnospiraceae bacterium]
DDAGTTANDSSYEEEDEREEEKDDADKKPSKHDPDKEDKADGKGDEEEDKGLPNFTLDSLYFQNYDREFVSGSTYNPVFDQRCFYADGVKVHMPETVGDIERLFNTHFIAALPMLGYTKLLLVNDLDEGIAIEYNGFDIDDPKFPNFPETDDPEYKEMMEELMEARVISLITKDGKNSHGYNGKQYYDLLDKYNVTFEDVGEDMNRYGYTLHIDNTLDTPEVYYQYADEELYVFYRLLTGNLNPDINVSAYIPFEVKKEETEDDWWQDTETYIYGYDFALNDYTQEDGTCYLYLKDYSTEEEYAYDYDEGSRSIISADPESARTNLVDYEELLEKISYANKNAHLDKVVAKR